MPSWPWFFKPKPSYVTQPLNHLAGLKSYERRIPVVLLHLAFETNTTLASLKASDWLGKAGLVDIEREPAFLLRNRGSEAIAFCMIHMRINKYLKNHKNYSFSETWCTNSYSSCSCPPGFSFHLHGTPWQNPLDSSFLQVPLNSDPVFQSLIFFQQALSSKLLPTSWELGFQNNWVKGPKVPLDMRKNGKRLEGRCFESLTEAPNFITPVCPLKFMTWSITRTPS